MIERRDQSHRIVTRLIETWAVDAAPIARTQAGTVVGYRRVDFADFGDMEKDPLVRKATRVAGRQHLHSH
ncbi:MAG: hypothetical protein ACREYE_17025 [Gammaproteobacteria bacterium]